MRPKRRTSHMAKHCANCKRLKGSHKKFNGVLLCPRQIRLVGLDTPLRNFVFSLQNTIP